jgi:preprotein translocase subunit SecE
VHRSPKPGVGGSSPSGPAIKFEKQKFTSRVMFNKPKEFIDDVQKEMKKVSWPEREQLVNSTFVVIVISALFTVFIFLADWVVSNLINLVY